MAPANRKPKQTKTPPKRGRGRPRREFDVKESKMVAHAKACGFTDEEIASIIGMCVETMHKLYSDELRNGLLRANLQVAGAMFRDALKGAATQQIFWMKARAGWKETARHEHTGADGGPIQWDLSRLTDEQLAQLETILAAVAPTGGGEG